MPFAGAGWRMLRGDEVGVLLADWLLRKGVRGTYATTIVSSTMLAAIAAKHGVPFAETLTGFKWISRAAPDLVLRLRGGARVTRWRRNWCGTRTASRRRC